MASYRCDACGHFLFLEAQSCPECGSAVGFHWPSLRFVVLPADGSGVTLDGVRWSQCTRWDWQCNWLVAEDDPRPYCLSCRFTRRRPDSSDTIALELLADAAVAKRRLLVQLMELRVPLEPWDEREGALAFDLVSSHSDGERVMIGHADGIITIDLAEGLDAHREHLRVQLGEAYRTMLGHFRHEVGHYYQGVLIRDEEGWSECRSLFGDERASYSDAISRHYATGAPECWQESFISEYATMHPWEDFAECFAHYLHITDTLNTAARAGVVLVAARAEEVVPRDVTPELSYAGAGMEQILWDWDHLSTLFNRVNRAMGQRDLYPFAIPAPVADKLAFIHRLIASSAAEAEPPLVGVAQVAPASLT